MHTYGPPDNGKRVLGSPNHLKKSFGWTTTHDSKCLTKMTAVEEPSSYCNFRLLDIFCKCQVFKRPYCLLFVFYQ